MINISLKAKHYYYIIYYLKSYSLERYFSLFNRIKTALDGNNDLEALFSVDASVGEVIDIYKTLTVLPEGQANIINGEMSDLLVQQIQTGAMQEIANGLVADENGTLPQGADWQSLGAAITGLRNGNITFRDSAIQNGKSIIDAL